MTTTLNIGLARTGGANLTLDQAVAAVQAHLGKGAVFALCDSDTEPTLVVRYAQIDVAGALDDVVHELASALGQECIAYHFDAIRKGRLAGPGADLWGAFSPDFFLTLEGLRLSSCV